MGQELELSLLLADYHRTAPILSGELSAPGLRFRRHRAGIGDACIRPVYEEYDVAEMSLSWYLMARERGEPVVALPIFPLRMQVHPYLFCGADSGIQRPEDLKGRRIGMDEYRLTVGLWVRGILEEYHGVRPADCIWVTAEPEGAGFRLPAGVKVEMAGVPTEPLLLEGKIDALLPPNIPASYRHRDPRIRRVYRDVRRTVNDYYRSTGIFPITHTLVVRESLAREHPWLAARLLDLFERAEARCRESYDYAKRLAFPAAALVLEEEEAVFGDNPWAHGLTPGNVRVLETFARYAARQGYVSRQAPLEELFAPIDAGKRLATAEMS